MEAEYDTAMRSFWRVHLDRLTATGHPLLEGVLSVGIRPPDLESMFQRLVENPDVRFPAELVEAPGDRAAAPRPVGAGRLVGRGAGVVA